MVREFTTGKTRKSTVDEFGDVYGFRVEVVPAMNPQERVHATRLIFPALWFDSVLCEKGLDAIRNYRKEYDEKRLVFKENPLHDWSSHGADSFGMIGVTHKEQAPIYARPIRFANLGVKDLEEDFVNPFGI